MKTGSPTLGFQHPAANIPHIPPPQPLLQRTAIQRHQARRSGHHLPKLAPGSSHPEKGLQSSPRGHPTPSSYVSSPTSGPATSPMLMQQDNFTPPNSAVLSPSAQYQNFTRGLPNTPFYQPPQMSPTSQRPGPPGRHQSSTSVLSNHSSGSRSRMNSASSPLMASNAEAPAAQLYSPPFSKHMDQLGKLVPFPQRWPLT